MTVEASATTNEQRKELLAQQVARAVAAGYRVETASDYQAVLVRGHRTNHLLHFFIGIFTLGIWWLLVWLPLWAFGGEKRVIVQVDPFGNVTQAKV